MLRNSDRNTHKRNIPRTLHAKVFVKSRVKSKLQTAISHVHHNPDRQRNMLLRMRGAHSELHAPAALTSGEDVRSQMLPHESLIFSPQEASRQLAVKQVGKLADGLPARCVDGLVKLQQTRAYMLDNLMRECLTCFCSDITRAAFSTSTRAHTAWLRVTACKRCCKSKVKPSGSWVPKSNSGCLKASC
eukprot:1733122-Amphidinium_carterae.2